MTTAVPALEIVERHFRAMQTGEKAEDELVNLFSTDCTYREDVGGHVSEFVGTDALRSWFRENCQQRPPEFHLVLNRVDLDGNDLVAEWTCNAAMFASPARGQDRFTIRAGLIERLDTRVTEMPQIRASH